MVNGLLVKSFPEIVSTDFTAQMEEQLDQVEDGTADWVKLLKTFYGPFKAPPHPPTIHLRPGATAAFALTTGDNPLDNARRCPAPYTRLQIGLAKGSASTTISAWIPYYGQFFQACTGYAVSEIVPKSDLHG